jgi:hypothetical protein
MDSCTNAPLYVNTDSRKIELDPHQFTRTINYTIGNNCEFYSLWLRLFLYEKARFQYNGYLAFIALTRFIEHLGRRKHGIYSCCQPIPHGGTDGITAHPLHSILYIGIHCLKSILLLSNIFQGGLQLGFWVTYAPADVRSSDTSYLCVHGLAGLQGTSSAQTRAE